SGAAVPEAITRVAGIAVLQNPFAGKNHAADLSSLFDGGKALGESLMPDVVTLLGGAPPHSYGKAAIVGVNGDPEHGAAIIHPRLGAHIGREPGGGAGVIG